MYVYVCMADDFLRKGKLIQFNLLKLCSVTNPVEQRRSPNHTASTESSTSEQRPHIPPRIFTMELTSDLLG